MYTCPAQLTESASSILYLKGEEAFMKTMAEKCVKGYFMKEDSKIDKQTLFRKNFCLPQMPRSQGVAATIYNRTEQEQIRNNMCETFVSVIQAGNMVYKNDLCVDANDFSAEHKFCLDMTEIKEESSLKTVFHILLDFDGETRQIHTDHGAYGCVHGDANCNYELRKWCPYLQINTGLECLSFQTNNTQAD
jgi:hypothetical protein